MIVAAVEHLGVEVQAPVGGDALQQVEDHVGAELAHARRGKLGLNHAVWPTAKIHGHQGESLVHRHEAVGGAHDPAPLAERLVDGATKADAGILGGVMLVDLEVAHGAHAQVEQAVARPEGEHVVEKAHPGADLGLAVAVKAQAEADLGLAGGTLDGGSAWLHHSAR